jgi:hypothetical protein
LFCCGLLLREKGYGISEDESDRIFSLIDLDRSGKLNEMEFAEFWVYVHGTFSPLFFRVNREL